MKTQATTSAVQAHDVQMSGESMSRPQAPGQSKASFRLFFFTSLSVLACVLALANVASAASSGQDQYVPQVPTGSGGGNQNTLTGVNPGSDGTLDEADIKRAAKKNADKRDAKSSDDEEGASGAVGGSGTTPTPPPAQSVVTSAKIGPVSRNTALILGALVLLGGLGVVAFGGGSGSIFAGGGAASSSPSNNTPS